MLSMGKSTISMALFNSYVTNYQRVAGRKISMHLYEYSRTAQATVPGTNPSWDSYDSPNGNLGGAPSYKWFLIPLTSSIYHQQKP